VLDAPDSAVVIGKSDQAGSAATNRESIGGAGGSISNITGEVGRLDVLAPSGGNSSGKAGAGGSISRISLTEVGESVHLIAAGNGGNGLPPELGGAVGLAGAGGSVSNLSIAGDIGDRTKNFGLTTDVSTMGGLVAGIRGIGLGSAVNGSISKVSADRIASILAGRPAANAVSYANAVTKISGIKINLPGGTIGADVNGDMDFDFIQGGANTTYEPSSEGTPTDGDTAIDGLIIVKLGGGGAALAITPGAKLVEVA
jgi:hypothetical protein